MTRTIIASLPEARAALEAARSGGVAAELESPPGAASIYGVLWFAELNRALLAEFPGVPFTLALDCGCRADLAHAALVEGIKRIRFAGHAEAARALADIAQQLNAELIAPELLYVIAEPDMSEADRDWIQSIRVRHDPQFSQIGPHFTFVFGVEGSLATALKTRAREAAALVRSFAVDLQSVRVFSDAPQDHYLFLVPDLGSRELTALHQALRLAPANDPPFMPHMTIGRVADAATANALAAEVNNMKRVVRGRVTALKIIGATPTLKREIATLQLTDR